MSNIGALTIGTPYTVFLQEGLYGNMSTLPATVSGLIHTENSVTGVVALPWPPTIDARVGTQVALTLPAVTAAGTGTVPNLVRGAITLPAVTLDASGTMGRRILGALTLPSPYTVEMRRGGTLRIELPSVTATGSIVPNQSFNMALTLRPVTIAGTITNAMGVLTGYLILPAVVGVYQNGGGVAVLPAVKTSGDIVAGTAATRVAWVTNLTHSALTQFSAFPFRAFARAYDRYFGAHFDSGLYGMGGDTDAAAAIDWEWRTGITDMQSRALKGSLGLYLDGVAERGCEFAAITDDGVRWYSHSPHGTPSNHQTQRVTLGKNLRSVNWGFGMRSTKGAYIEIDSLSPEWQISPKRNL